MLTGRSSIGLLQVWDLTVYCLRNGYILWAARNSIVETIVVCGPDKPYMNPSDLEVAHTRAFTAAVQRFSKTRKMGGAEYSARYLERLQSTLQQLGNEYRVANTNKNIFQTFRTPAVFVVILVIFYLITGISEFIGLSTVTNMFLFPFYMALVTLMTWLFLSYTGRAPELASAIDSAADVVIQKVITPAVQRIGQRSVQQLVGVTDRPTTSATLS
ncbi:hypothetical protein PHET_07612 [Paragonimus heterotremus]|uniref:Uncharacterized protein n=1 Tax=Paragonimus heterotremus TaxID=100268 RepID=A0A8J4WFQ2_9TREM|nr:hypothetical protein PHET_07612 [Paragonimus heterotremus]